MPVFSEGLTCNIGDSASPEVFTELALLEVPEPFSGARATFPRRTTADTQNTKKYGIGFEEGDELALVVERDFTDVAQDALRVALAAGAEISIQFVITDGSVTETSTALFLVTMAPVSPTDPNGDGDNQRQTFNVKRNGDYTTVES